MNCISSRLSFYFIIGLLFFSSCEGDQLVKYRWTKLQSEHIDNSGLWPASSSSDSIAKEAYGLRLNLYPIETERKGRYFDEYESSVVNENPVDSIHISSNFDFYLTTDTLASGTALNSLFYVFQNKYSTAYQLSQHSLTVSAYYNENYADRPYPDYADLLLIAPVSIAQQHVFHIYIRLQDGTQWNDSTSLIRLF